MPREHITEKVAESDQLRIRGKAGSETEGAFDGLAINERGEPVIILHVEGAVLPFAYALDEIESLVRVRAEEGPAREGPEFEHVQAADR